MNALPRNLSASAAAILIVVSLSACRIPNHFTDAPAVAGRIISGTTHRPVVGATVSMTSDPSSARTYTDQAGEFHLPVLEHWGWIEWPSDGYETFGTLRVEAPHYRPYVETGVGLPELEPLSKTQSTGTDVHKSPDLEHIHIILTPGA